jgi:predicted transcriptional regulator
VTSREEAQRIGAARGFGRGFFEWRFPVNAAACRGARRITILFEASSAREDETQTDCYTHPSTLRMLLNGVPVYRTILPNHPHDARGALTYLRGGRGAYGYLCHATVEGALLEQALRARRDDELRVRCLVPQDGLPVGGLTIYGYDCGRYPIGPTLIVE